MTLGHKKNTACSALLLSQPSLQGCGIQVGHGIVDVVEGARKVTLDVGGARIGAVGDFSSFAALCFLLRAGGQRLCTCRSDSPESAHSVGQTCHSAYAPDGVHDLSVLGGVLVELAQLPPKLLVLKPLSLWQLLLTTHNLVA